MTLQLIPGLRVHDARLFRVTLAQDESWFDFSRTDGSRVRLLLWGCDAFGVVGLRERAVVLSVEVFLLSDQGASPDEEHWRTLVGADYQPSAADIEEYRRRASHLIWINNSLGGSVAVLCQGFHVKELTDAST